MRPFPRRLAIAVLLPAVLLGGCGGSEETSDGAAATAAATASTQSGVTVTGAAGSKPTVEAPDAEAPSELVTEVLEQGDGDTVATGDLLVAHYLGQKWADGAVFDNSYDRGEPSGFSIGVGGVIPGWDKGLVGQQVGSRVLLVVPPAEGYGEQGQPQAGIQASDTLVFVVDIVDRFGKELAASGTPVDDVPAGLPEVSSTPGEAPTITVAENAKPPAEQRSAVIIEGDGDAIDPEQTLVAHVLRYDYDSGNSQGTWETAPIPVQAGSVPGLADVLDGQNVGSRVLLDVPATGEGEAAQPAAAYAVDVVGMF